MKIRLTSVDPFQPELNLTLDDEKILIGRNGDSHLRLEDRWVSRRHCEIRQQNGQVIVRDLSSKYGTLLNGQPVEQSPLSPGDELTVGIRTFRVTYRRAVIRRKPILVKEVGNVSVKPQAG